ncbi:MAG: PhzF family phenazine biosynthesis protein [Halofilum sp. (in: g-proteobacteria)]
MTRYRYYTCDVFTRKRFGGNPLAAVPDARGLDTAAMQALAREFNYSETTFVFPSDNAHDRLVRIFTPTVEVPFAGHPNVGTAFMLAELGEIEWNADAAMVRFEEKAGTVPVRLTRDPHGGVFCELTTPEALSLGPELAVHEVAAAVGLEGRDVVTGVHSPRVASVGLPFVVVEIATRAALARAAPDVRAMQALQARGVTPDVHLYTRDAGDFDLHTRMFAPLDGVPEDPATGSANSALMGLLGQADPAKSGQWRWRIAQGVDMGRPSELYGTVEKMAGAVSAVRIGGYCVPVFGGGFSW